MNIFLQQELGLHNNIARSTLVVISLAIVDSMGEAPMGIVFAPVCSLVMKIIVCPPKEKFSKRHEEGHMDSKTHVRKSTTNQN
jgi:hypothetical protein